MHEELKEQMHQFLYSNWNLSMDSVEGALDELIQDYGRASLQRDLELIEKFHSSGEADEWKTRFIMENTDIYWTNMEESPLEWLNGIKLRFNKSSKINREDRFRNNNPIFNGMSSNTNFTYCNRREPTCEISGGSRFFVFTRSFGCLSMVTVNRE